MPDRTDIASRLQTLIGRRARYQGELYEIFEVLENDPPALVLQNVAHTRIQADQHGEAHRRVPETVTVPLAMEDDALDLGAMEIELLESRERPEPALR